MLTQILRCLALGALACGLSLVLTPLARWFMRRIGAVDQPDSRRVNKVPIPRGGGLAVVASCFLALGGGLWLWPGVLAASPFFAVLPAFAVSSAILVGVGFVDDRFGVPPILKLGAQIVAAGILCWAGARLTLPAAWGDWAHAAWVYVPLTLAWYIGVVNAFNLIDGLDGLSSGLAIIATIGMVGAAFFVDAAILPAFSFIFIGALLGFLRYNYNPASVFLGDSGSLFVGLTLATIALVSRRSDAFIVSMGVPILCIGVPLIDTCLAILRRTLRAILRRVTPAEALPQDGAHSAAVMTADRDHIHHRFLSLAGGNQRRAVWGLYGLAVGFLAVGFLALALREAKATVFIIGFGAFATVVVRAMTNVELWDAGRLLARPGARCGRRSITVILYLLGDLVCMVGLYVAVLLFHFGRVWPEAWPRLVNVFLAFMVPVSLCLVAVRAYTRIWGRSTRKDSFMLIAAVAIGSLFSHLIIAYLVPELATRFRPAHILWAAFLPMPLLLMRLAKPAFLQWLAASENARLRRRSLTDPAIPRVLFYGAGVNLRAYITLFETNVTRNNVALIGILDDNPGLRGRIFRDLPILGPLEILTPERLAQLKPTRIIVTTPAIGPDRLADIQAFCKQHFITLARSSIEESILPL